MALLDEGEMKVRKARAFIKRERDGEVRDAGLFDWGRGLDSWWREGNASCDCNRSIFFGEIEEAECGCGKYAVKLQDSETGEVLFADGSFAQ